MRFQAVLMIVFVASAYQAIVIAVDPPSAAAPDATTPNATDSKAAPVPNPITTVTPAIADTNTTTATPNVTTTTPETTTVITTSTTPSTTTTAKPTTTTAPTTVAPNTTTTIAPSTTTTEKPGPAPCRRFDGPSFIGGIVLTVGLIAIGCVAHKIYKSKFDRNYHTL